MRRVSWATLGLCVCLCWSLGAVAVAGDAVVELTDQTFDDTLRDNAVVMVKFYAPWCGHCKAFAPEYEKAAQMIKQQGKTYVLANLDATVHTATGQRFGIQSYPTIKLFLQRTPINYDAPRKAESVISFIDKNILGPSTELKTAEEVQQVKAGEGLRVSVLCNG
jgi:protein disulfide-isomerase-like protein